MNKSIKQKAHSLQRHPHSYRKTSTNQFNLKLLMKKKEKAEKDERILKTYALQKNKKMIIIPSFATYENSFLFTSTKNPYQSQLSQEKKKDYNSSSTVRKTNKDKSSLTFHHKHRKSSNLCKIVNESQKKELLYFSSKFAQGQMENTFFKKKRMSQGDHSFQRRDLSGGKQTPKNVGFKIQMILRRKIGLNFENFMKQYCKRMKFSPDTKIFIFVSNDHWLKKALLQRKWVQNPDTESQAFHFKWTSKINQKFLFPEQMINHFSNSDLLTSKYGLAANTKTSPSLKMQIPRTYDLGTETQQFIRNYEQTIILNGLKKLVKKIQIPLVKIDDTKLQENLQKMILNKEFESEEGTMNIHIPFCVQLCAYCEQIRCSQERQEMEEKYKLNRKSFLNLMRFCHFDPTYSQEFEVYFEKKGKFIGIQFSQNDINHYVSTKSFGFPSKSLLRLLYSYFCYFNENLKTFQSEGTKNLWICKNRNSSKGAGIFLASQMNEILKNKGNKLVQKYIENCCLYQSQNFSEVKFDLRIWVLVQSFSPLVSFYFSNFYGRLCFDQYDLQNLSPELHLTNYNINKKFFTHQQSSIITSPQFFKFMAKKMNLSIPKAQKKFYLELQILLLNTLNCYSQSIEGTSQNFQLYGFDILPSQNFKLHLLEVNLSPACKERHQWLNEITEKMGEGLLNIVLDQNYPQKGQSGWKLIPTQ